MVSPHENPKRQILTLVMTEYCNLQCVYCYEHKADKRVLPVEIAQKAISEAFENPKFDELEIDFFGGEPFVAFKNITEICEWLWSRDWPKPRICFATTNGTLIHGKIKEWVAQHKDRLILGLSLDGTPSMHNTNRSNSYADIDLDFFREMWPFQPAKMTVSRQTLPDMAEGIIHIHNLGFKLTANLAFGVDWQAEDFEIYATEMKKLADYYLAHPEIEPCNIMTMGIDAAAHFAETTESGNRKIANFCGAGDTMLSIDRFGNKYPCQTFMPMTINKEYDAGALAKTLACQDNCSDPKCKDCCLLPVCQTCYGMNYVVTGSPFLREKSICEFSKIKAKAVAYLLSEMLTNRERNYAFLKGKNEEELIYMIKGIKLVNDAIHI